MLDRVFGLIRLKPRVAVECDTSRSLFTATKRGAMIALSTLVFKQVTGKARLSVFDGTTEHLSVGIAQARNGAVRHRK
ncbi:MAG: hypothetical protein WBL39_23730 [Terrimicrobiaceae bacterium]